MLSTKQGRIRADFAKIQALFKEFHEKYKASEQKMSDTWKAQSDRFRQFWQTKMINDQLETIPQSDLIPIAQILNESVQRKTPEEKDVTPVARTGMTSDNILSALKNIHADKAIRSKIDDLLKSEDPKRQAELITQIYDMNKGKRNYITGDNAVFLNDLLFAFSPEKNLRVLSMEHRYRLMDYLGIEKGEIDSMSIGEKVIDSRQKLLEFKDKLGPDITTWEYSNFLYSKPIKSEWKSEVGSTADDGETSVGSGSAQNAPTWWVEKTTVSGHPLDGVSQFDSTFGKSLWSPQVGRRNVRIYKAMKNVKPQDVILHINQEGHINSIIGISRAKASYGEFTIPKGTRWTKDGEKPGFYVPLTDYVQLITPIKWEDLRSVKGKELQQICSMERNLFYDRNLDLNQGKYLTRAPQELVTTINDYYRSKTGNDLPWYSSAGTTSFSDPLMARIRDALESSYQVILFGPPGTGKTYAARKFVADVSDSRKVFITFHPSYSYEEFIEGIRPRITDSGQIVFEVRDGKFKALCIDAMNTLLKSAGISKTWDKSLPELDQEEKAKIFAEASKEENRYYLIIDEINRGDISKIFGELITLVEADKRLTKENEIVVPLAYSDKTIRFGVPPNLYIIGTMNTADRSIALIDVALRRRFRFVELLPDYGTLSRELQSLPSEISSLAVNSLKGLNERLRVHYDRDHQIGHGYFIKLKNLTKYDAALKGLKQIWFYEIIPLLQEYFYNNSTKLFEILNKDERLFEVPPDSNNRTFVLKDADSISDSDFLEFLKGIS